MCESILNPINWYITSDIKKSINAVIAVEIKTNPMNSWKGKGYSQKLISSVLFIVESQITYTYWCLDGTLSNGYANIMYTPSKKPN